MNVSSHIFATLDFTPKLTNPGISCRPETRHNIVVLWLKFQIPQLKDAEVVQLKGLLQSRNMELQGKMSR